MRIASRRVAIAIAAVAATVTPLAASAAPASAAFHFSRVSVIRGSTDCTNTKVIAVNDAGSYVGEVYCGLSRGFIQVAGKTTLIKVPARKGGDTQVTAVASNGIVSLFTQHSYKPPNASYLRSASGKLTALRDPKARRLGTQVLSVNAKGTAVGVYFPGKTTASQRAFRYSGGTFKTFALKVKGATNVALDTINDSGEMGGLYVDKHGIVQSFLVHAGKVEHLAEPRPSTKRGTGFGISELANDGTFVTERFISGGAVVSYLWRVGSYTRITVPRAFGVSTAAMGVNSSGVMVGAYVQPNGKYRGFIATPAG